MMGLPITDVGRRALLATATLEQRRKVHLATTRLHQEKLAREWREAREFHPADAVIDLMRRTNQALKIWQASLVRARIDEATAAIGTPP
jgi:hypothetical protein